MSWEWFHHDRKGRWKWISKFKCIKKSQAIFKLKTISSSMPINKNKKYQMGGQDLSNLNIMSSIFK